MGRRGRERANERRHREAMRWSRIAALAALAALPFAALALLITRDDSGSGGEPLPSKASAGLQIVDIAVSNQRPSSIRPGRNDDVADGIGGEYDAREAAGLVLTLRNASSRVSVINRVRFTVVRYAELSAEGCIPGAGPIAVSANYQVRLPAQGRKGQVIEAKVSQQLRPQSADRMRIGLTLDDPSPLEVFDNGDGTGASRLYEMRVELVHDLEPKPLYAGRVLVAIPFPYIGLLRRTENLAVRGDCIEPNRLALTRMLSGNAVRSSHLEAVVDDSKAAK